MSSHPAVSERVRARELVLAFGWHPSSYQILNPGFRLWFAARGDAVVGYVDHAGVRVVAAEPVCAEHRLGEVVGEFERGTALTELRICFLAAESRLAAVLGAAPAYSRIVLGAHPVLVPEQWHATVSAHSSLRAQLNRARNKGVSVEEWAPGRAAADPELRRCLARWLAARGLPPLHFLVETELLDHLSDRRVFVARRSEVVAFVVATPIPLRRGWLLEQIVRVPNAPNGTAELLVAGTVEALGRDGAKQIALGVAPLSERAGRSDLRPAVGVALKWARAHGRRFYSAAGLERFKAKFQPALWEPVYAISSERAFSAGTLWAIASAYCGGSPIKTGLLAAGHAIRQEIRWVLHMTRS